MRVIVDLELPEGATHHCGLVTDEPMFLKMKLIAEIEHWFEYDPARKDWFLFGHNKPLCAKPLEFVE